MENNTLKTAVNKYHEHTCHGNSFIKKPNKNGLTHTYINQEGR